MLEFSKLRIKILLSLCNRLNQENLNLRIIQLFLDCILNIINDHNLNQYSYKINEISYLIQNLEAKLREFCYHWRTKNREEQVFRDSISILFERYTISNENKVSNIIGSFKFSIDNKFFIV